MELKKFRADDDSVLLFGTYWEHHTGNTGLYWYIKCLCATLTVTNMKTILRKGLLSKYTTEVWHRDVRNVQIQQSFFQRMFGVGRIMISSAGQGGIEIDFVGVPNPSRVKEMIDTHRNS